MTFCARAASVWAEPRSPDSCVMQHVQFSLVLCGATLLCTAPDLC